MARRAVWMTVALAVAVGLVAMTPAFAAGTTAKDIFYTPGGPGGATQPQMALNYKILLLRNCELQQVPDNFVFYGGDKFRLAFQANMDGFLYIFNKGTTGAGRLLFPDPRINAGSNRVTRYTEYVVPSSGWFNFDRNPGTEQLHVFFSPKPLGNVNYAPGAVIPGASWNQVVAPYFAKKAKAVASKAVKDIVFVDEGQDVAPLPQIAVGPPPVGGTPPPVGGISPGVAPPPPNLTPNMYVAAQIAPGAAYDSLLIHSINLIHR